MDTMFEKVRTIFFHCHFKSIYSKLTFTVKISDGLKLELTQQVVCPLLEIDFLFSCFRCNYKTRAMSPWFDIKFFAH